MFLINLEMKVLVTGHQGFVGSHLIKALKKRPRQFTIQGVDKKSGFDITDDDKLFSIKKPDLIIHLAASCSTAKSLDNPRQDFLDNVVGTFNVAELARQTGAGVIYSSSCKVRPTPLGNRAPYGLSKYVGELYLKEYAIDYGLRFVINRFGTIYGPGQDASPESGWLTWFIKASKNNLPITIYGDGRQSRDVLFVSDAVALLVDQITHFALYQGEIYEVGGGRDNELSLIQVLDHLNYQNFRFGPERVGDVKRFVADLAKVSAVNGWLPKIGWEEGIQTTLKSLSKD